MLTESDRMSSSDRADGVTLLSSNGYEVTSVLYSTPDLFLQRLADLTVDLILVEVRPDSLRCCQPRLGGQRGVWA